MPIDFAKLGIVKSNMLEAALGLKNWRDVLAELSVACDAQGANLITIRPQLLGAMENTENLDEFREFYFKNEIFKFCIRRRAIPLMDSRGIAVDADYTSETERERDPYYQEFLRRFGLLWSAYIGFKVDGDLISCMLHRGVDQPPFTQAEQAALLALTQQLSVAALISRRVGDARLDGLREAFEHSALRCLFFDHNGHVVDMNEAAAKTIAASGVKIQQGMLESPFRNDGRKLRDAVVALNQTDGSALQPEASCLIRRVDRRPLAMRLSRLEGSLRDPFRLAVVMAIISDPDSQPPVREELLRSMFQLTPAEIRIASALMSGRGLQELAEEFGITYETARTHMKNILHKTGVNRQSELIALIGRLS